MVVAPYPGHTTEEVARRGQELYERKIRREVEPEHDGCFLVVDIESGDYEIADDDLTASDRMLVRRPDAMLYGLRVGRDYACLPPRVENLELAGHSRRLLARGGLGHRHR